ncbi:NUDIX domain-containing protein [Flavisphingomonas formosensis]|uniref:NUDIX domain-containing protein n=1 Tax=Flavisphingomonas formosensis TaxID=861534 RepID=UPI0012FCA959|nr:NUDIX domain-containing protein [Sphingomonas formosensis]
MNPRSAGVLLYRRRDGRLEVLLVHPGGPYWRSKDMGAWQIPKGAIEPDEADDAAARREVEEELGIALAGDLQPLMEIRQAGGKRVQAFLLEQDVDADAIRSMTFEIEWPPRSGRMQTFPEVDAARWFGLADARAMMLPSQQPLLDQLELVLAGAA